ncbi:hypothetical protein [Arthrobacter sp. Leaf234]|uniref:hypothetical protein n=1 Tax=Arthrobacter sp. Leaf234 TaxID=1736303 RepID=UPI001F226289|nr:hypothetical protein [Arthrobacter sp. Leaf234]
MPAARLMRGMACAAFATFLAGASHAVAGGTVPLPAILLALPLASLLCVMLAGQRLSPLRVVMGVSASQIIFHFLFAFFALVPSAPAALTGHQHDGAFTASPLPVTPATSSYMSAMDMSMVCSHLVAGVVTIVLVRHGEQLWWSLIGILAAAVTHIVRLVRLCPVSRQMRRAVDAHAPFGLYELLHSDARLQLRGPPAPHLSSS